MLLIVSCRVVCAFFRPIVLMSSRLQDEQLSGIP